jgi:seryl-tRNA synthetase
MRPKRRGLSRTRSAIRSKRAAARVADLESECRAILVRVPNLPRESVPEGADDSANVEVHRWGTPRNFKDEGFDPKDRVALGVALGILDFEQNLFKLQFEGEYYLRLTSEVPLTNLHREEILEEKVMLLSYTAYTPSFLSEAGSYGRDVHDLLRQHQFGKAELVKITRPEESYDAFEKLSLDAETVLEQLGLS